MSSGTRGLDLNFNIALNVYDCGFNLQKASFPKI